MSCSVYGIHDQWGRRTLADKFSDWNRQKRKAANRANDSQPQNNPVDHQIQSILTHESETVNTEVITTITRVFLSYTESLRFANLSLRLPVLSESELQEYKYLLQRGARR